MEAENRECPKCRAEVFQGACFCMQCGMRLEARGSVPSSMRLKAAAPQPESARQSEKGARVTDTGYSLTTRRAGNR